MSHAPLRSAGFTGTAHRLVAASFIERFSAEWQAATSHPFLTAVADGSLPKSAFDTWLAQDYVFVADLLGFQARLLARAPRPAQAVLAAGLVGLEAELGWFEAHAERRGLALDVARAPTTARYQAVLEALHTQPYAAAITALWAIERAYLEAWRLPEGMAPGGTAYREFVEHWTSPAFADYVAGLATAVDLALGSATPEVSRQARVAFVDVAYVEHEFWEMAWSWRSK